MEICSFEGNADLYGLGIRLGFYLQWFSFILANFVLVKGEVASNGFAFAIYISAVFLNLAVQTIRGAIDPLDVYVTDLLCFGSQFFLAPLLLWRLITRADPFLDATRWTVVSPGLFLRVARMALRMASSTFQLWFWASHFTSTFPSDCLRYGFLFVKLPLDDPMLRAVNISLLSMHELIFLLRIIQHFIEYRRGLFSKRTMIRTTETHWQTLQLIRSTLLAAVAVIIIVATEMSIKWNNIKGVDTLSTSGQLIPFMISIGMFLRVVWICFTESKDQTAFHNVFKVLLNRGRFVSVPVATSGSNSGTATQNPTPNQHMYCDYSTSHWSDCPNPPDIPN